MALREVWRTAPWLYDGRAATMEEALRVHWPEVGTLSEQELAELVAYVLSL